MKPIKKSTLFLLIYIILGVVSTFFSMKFMYPTQEKRSTRVNLIPAKSGGVILPIEIKGKVFHFLWDTGSSHSSISQKAVDRIEMDSTCEINDFDSLNSEKAKPQFCLEKASLKLGNFEIKQSLQINNKVQEVDGILGGDIIGMYSWLIDFEKESVIISEKKQTIQIGAKEQQYELELISSETTPYCKVTINDTIQEHFLFNSGCVGLSFPNNECLLPDLFFALWDSTDLDSVYHYLEPYSKKISVRNSLYTGGVEYYGYFLKDLNICGYMVSSPFIIIRKDSSYRTTFPSQISFGTNKEIRGAGIITGGFMRRFDRVYFDPKHKTFSLIKSSEKPDFVTESTNGVLKLMNLDSLNAFIN